MLKWKHLILGLGILALPACTTTSGGTSSSEARRGASTLSYSKAPIVHQTNGRNIMRKLDRDSWVEIRNSTKSEHIKLYAALGAGEWDVAVSDARTYLQSHPQDEVALTVLAIGLSMKKNYSMAAYYANLLNQYHPGNPEVHNLLGLALMNKPGANFEDYQAAKQKFEQAFDGSGQQIASGLNLAHLNLEMGNAEAARDIFQAVRPRCGDCNEAMMGYGIALSRLRDFAKAEAVFSEVLKRDAHSAYARFYLALVAKYGRNDNKTAMTHLTALVEDPEIKNVEMQRKGNFLLRRIQAEVYSQPKDSAIAKQKPANTSKKAAMEAEIVPEDLEQVINAE
ncbi:MAG TPA: tetratricopeptide repeat protein [Oligoflexus sp.]|uniref:tetratricopeptide repeat protein n=1 Tax=Oligoflexus sp. TaxID=1971216 RepID=UPI002D4CA282|nr:tetratricopeptide repeat protein [Oligoflexus sp.]HYX34848.1 tetratricopeptide repeat protein [Oligoflexus sp.]